MIFGRFLDVPFYYIFTSMHGDVLDLAEAAVRKKEAKTNTGT